MITYSLSSESEINADPTEKEQYKQYVFYMDQNKVCSGCLYLEHILQDSHRQTGKRTSGTCLVLSLIHI